jgi:hypothetical protein
VVPASEEWYQREIQKEHPIFKNPYVLPWMLETQKATAFLDFQWLQQGLDGAPDSNDNSLYHSLSEDSMIHKYPIRMHSKPHWLKKNQLKTIRYQEYFTWNFLKACALNSLPMSEGSARWRDWVGTQ